MRSEASAGPNGLLCIFQTALRRVLRMSQSAASAHECARPVSLDGSSRADFAGVDQLPGGVTSCDPFSPCVGARAFRR